MTYNPPTLQALGRFWTEHGGVNLGVVGDSRHQATGTSYHLGKSALRADAYSRRTARDRNGLTEAASAIDLGKLGGSLTGLRAFSHWLVTRCRQNAVGTRDIREVIYTRDGVNVLRWDRERGYDSQPQLGEADNSHLTHTHVSFYRDSEARDKRPLFAPFFEQPDTATEDEMVTGWFAFEKPARVMVPKGVSLYPAYSVSADGKITLTGTPTVIDPARELAHHGNCNTITAVGYEAPGPDDSNVSSKVMYAERAKLGAVRFPVTDCTAAVRDAKAAILEKARAAAVTAVGEAIDQVANGG